MKKYTKIFIASLAVFAVSSTIVSAASLSVSPASLSKKINDSFTVSVGVSTGGSKVCVVEGTIALDKLTCAGITVGSGLMAQTSPTCSSPTFSIGIPFCTTADKELFSVALKAPIAGKATLGFTGVDIIGGEGMSLGTSASTGEYTITAAVVETPEPIVTTTIKDEVVPSKKPSPDPVKKVLSQEEKETVAVATSSSSESATTTATAETSNNLAAAETGAQGMSIIWVAGIGFLAIIFGFVVAKKMKK